jgi:hypothetical protein
MKNDARRPDPLWGRVSKGLTAAVLFSVWLAEARGEAISDLTAYYNKVDAALAAAIERGDIKDARSLLILRNNLAKELTQKKSLQNSPFSPKPTPTLKTAPARSIVVATPSPQVKAQSERASQGKRKVRHGRRDLYLDDGQKQESGAGTKASAAPKETPSPTTNAGDTDTSLERWMGPNFNNPR